jgi:hypothetical protein
MRKGALEGERFREQKPKTVVASALGECVHVDGVTNFLRLPKSIFFECAFDGSEPHKAVLAFLKGQPAQASRCAAWKV